MDSYGLVYEHSSDDSDPIVPYAVGINDSFSDVYFAGRKKTSNSIMIMNREKTGTEIKNYFDLKFDS